MIFLYTDGACRGNPGIGSYAYTLYKNNTLIKEGGSVAERTTNNIMELSAIYYGLLECSYSDSIEVFSDSKYAISGITQWRFKWRSSNWLKADKKPVLNIDLWKKLDALIDQFHHLKFSWVKGHSTNPYNNYVDLLANRFLDEKQSYK